MTVGALAHLTASQSVNNGAMTPVALTSTASGFDTEAAAGRTALLSGGSLVIPALYDGWYARPTGGIRWQAAAGNERHCAVRKNGARYQGGGAESVLGPVGPNRCRQNVVGAPVQVAAGDAFTVEAFQNTGSPLNIEHPEGTFCGIELIDPAEFSGAMLRLNVSTAFGSGFEWIDWHTTPVYDVGGWFDPAEPRYLRPPSGSSFRYLLAWAGLAFQTNSSGWRSINIDKLAPGGSTPGSFSGGPMDQYRPAAGFATRICLGTGWFEHEDGSKYCIQQGQNAGSTLQTLTDVTTFFAIEGVA